MLLRVLIAIAVIAALAVGGIYFKGYLDQNAAADELQAQIQNTNKTIVNVANQNQDVQIEISSIKARYADAQAAVEAEKEVMPEKVNPNEIVRSILVLGEQTNVTVIPLNTQDWTSVKIGQHNYFVFRMSMELNSAEENIVNYVEQLQYSLYETLVIENLSLNKIEITPTPTETPTPTTTAIPIVTVKGNLNIAIYAE